MTRPGSPADVIAGTLQRLAATGVPVSGVPAQLPASLFPKPERPALTGAERRELDEAIRGGGMCPHCGGIHAAPGVGCPRLASFELGTDGHVRAGTYWPAGTWEDDRVVFADEAKEPQGDTGVAAGG